MLETEQDPMLVPGGIRANVDIIVLANTFRTACYPQYY